MCEQEIGDHNNQYHDAATGFVAEGVIVSTPDDDVVVCNGWAIIGTLIQGNNLVEVVPRFGLVASQTARLLAVAAQVWLLGKACLDNWVYWPGLGWAADVAMRQSDVSEDLRDASLLSLSADGDAPRVLAGFSAPSAR